MTELRAVCFDAFGTLVGMSDHRDPFGALRGSRAKEFASRVYLRPVTLNKLASECGIIEQSREFERLKLNFAAQCASFHSLPKSTEMWADARSFGLRIAVCCNLAFSHVQSLLACLPGIPDVLVFSFDAGILEPAPQFYGTVCKRLGLEADDVLFVSDSQARRAAAGEIGMMRASSAEFGIALAGELDGAACEAGRVPQSRRGPGGQ